jgi:hypothetical protein
MSTKALMAVLIAVFLSACNTGKSAEATGLFVKQGELEWQVSSAQTLTDFKRAMSAKQRVLLKQLPEFQYQIRLQPDGEKAVWYLSSDGYVTRNPEHGDAVYRIDFDVNRLRNK